MKIKFIFLLFIAFYLTIIVRLFFLQVLFTSNNTSPYLKTNKLYPIRGRIYDQKNQSLVLNQNSYQLYIEPKKVVDK
ncbi:MAG TPA: penicillin-binding protein 2, partial [Patescibacteria group bacterium]